MTRKEFERITPEQAGICSEDIEWLLDQLESGITEPHGLMIMRHGKICAEGWWSPYAPGIRHGQQSHSKTYAATAIGIAYTEGLVIYEQPQPDMSQPDTASPDTENPDMVKPDTEKPAELNIEKSNTEKSITYGSSTDSIPFRETAAARPLERKGRDAMSVTEIENYRELILENIEYDCLKQRYPLYLDDLNEIVELLVETVCAKRKTTRISGADFPHEIVRSRFLKLDSSHIEFVMDCLQKNTTQVRNMKQYLLAVLFNAPTTMNNHFTSLVNHDMHAGGW